MGSIVGLREGRMLVVGLCTAQFMLILDVIVIYVALPTISRDLPIADSTMHLVGGGQHRGLWKPAVPVTSSAGVGCY